MSTINYSTEKACMVKDFNSMTYSQQQQTKTPTTKIIYELKEIINMYVCENTLRKGRLLTFSK